MSYFSGFNKYYINYSFQDPATSFVEVIIELYSFILFFLIIISILVLYILLLIIDLYVLPTDNYNNHVYRFNSANEPYRLGNTFLNRLVIYSDLMISNYMYVEPPYFIDRFDPHVFKRSRENRKKFRVYNTDYPILSTFRYVYLISEKQKSYYHQDLPLLYHITRFHRETVAWETHARYLLPLKVSQMDMVTLYILIKKQFLNKNNLLLNNKVLELLWTILPCLILLTIAVPSFFYLYTAEETSDTFLTVKVIGNQWFWSYDYTQLAVFNEANNNNLEIDNFIIDSYMEPEDYLDKKRGASRLLEADNFLLLPINVHIKLLISSSDVLHSFCVPSLGLKVDAVPGRLNQLDVFIHRTGIFYGQCSEICGIGHGFMPICLYAISYLNFLIGTL